MNGARDLRNFSTYGPFFSLMAFTYPGNTFIQIREGVLKRCENGEGVAVRAAPIFLLSSLSLSLSLFPSESARRR